MEPIYRKNFLIDEQVCDCFGRLKPSAILYYVQEMAGEQVNGMALAPSPESKGLIWVITRHRVQISRLPNKAETIRLETWPMPTTRVAYPRSVVAYDENDRELFRSVSLWVLVNRDSRTMVLPEKSGVLIPGIVRGNELPSPRGLIPPLCTACAERQVRFGDLDTNMHMNNCRYLEWVYDLLPASFHREHRLLDATLCYPAEAREGDVLHIRWELDAEGALHVDIQRPEKDKDVRIFTADLRYDSRCSVN